MIAAAFLDAHNALVAQVRAMPERAMPPTAPTKPGASRAKPPG